MSFPQKVKVDAMVASERHCCLCHKSTGIKIECHHIISVDAGGPNTFENCIPLCFDCHAEVGAYNSKHPKGTRYTATELKKRRNAWYQEIKNRRTLRDPMRPKKQPIELESFEEARSVAEEKPTDKTNLRRGVVKGWQLLAKDVFKITNVSSENFEPLGEDVRRALAKLSVTRVPDELQRSISSLQYRANQAANHSPYAGYDPDIHGVLKFIEECDRVRSELVGIHNSGGL